MARRNLESLPMGAVDATVQNAHVVRVDQRGQKGWDRRPLRPVSERNVW